MSQKSKLRLIVSGYDHKSVDLATKEIIQKIIFLDKVFSGPTPLPTKRKLFSLLISPHKHKSAQEQFEVTTHRRSIEILGEIKKRDLEELNKIILPHTTYVKVKEISLN